MDRTFYKEKIEELLADTDTYVVLPQGNQDQTIMNKITKLVKRFENETTKPEKQYITNFSWKTSNFYGLPKIHKSSLISNSIKEQNCEYITLPAPADLKMRPIVAGPVSPTHRLSNYIDLILKPLCQHVLSFIKDDMDFLQNIPNEVD